jgi:hypothetical protein
MGKEIIANLFLSSVRLGSGELMQSLGSYSCEHA